MMLRQTPNPVVYNQGQGKSQLIKKNKENSVQGTRCVNAPDPGLVGQASETEVIEKTTRRHFSLEEKQRILGEAAACERGGLGKLLRREGLYSPHLTHWRHEQRQGGARRKATRPRAPAS